MSGFAKATVAPKPKTEDAKKAAWLSAAILAVIALVQLATFPSFVNVFVALHLGGFFAWLTIFAEIVAVPFLLEVRLSRAFRAFSMLCLWIASAMWIVVTLTALAKQSTVGILINTEAAPILPSWWLFFIALAFGFLSVWTSWGLWPLRPVATRAKSTRAKKAKK